MTDIIWATPFYEFLRQRNASPLEKTIRFFMTSPTLRRRWARSNGCSSLRDCAM